MALKLDSDTDVVPSVELDAEVEKNSRFQEPMFEGKRQRCSFSLLEADKNMHQAKVPAFTKWSGRNVATPP